MAKKGPAYYNVTITAVRNYEPGQGPPKKNQFWQFSQAVQSTKGSSGALAAMGDKFFKTYPNHAIVLPSGGKGQSIVTRDDKSRLNSYLGEKGKGDVAIDSADAMLRINKMRALSGDTPVSLTPKSDQEYADRLQKNQESVQWWHDPITQMPAPIYVLDKSAGSTVDAPGMITYKGRTYQRVEAKLAEELPASELKELFFATMEEVADQMTDIHRSLTEAGQQLLNDEEDAQVAEALSVASKQLYNEVLKSMLNARDLAAILEKKQANA